MTEKRFRVEQEQLSEVQLRIEGGGNRQFYEAEKRRVEQISALWDEVSRHGLTAAQRSKLIESKHRLLRYIESEIAKSHS